MKFDLAVKLEVQYSVQNLRGSLQSRKFWCETCLLIMQDSCKNLGLNGGYDTTVLYQIMRISYMEFFWVYKPTTTPSNSVSRHWDRETMVCSQSTKHLLWRRALCGGLSGAGDSVENQQTTIPFLGEPWLKLKPATIYFIISSIRPSITKKISLTTLHDLAISWDWSVRSTWLSTPLSIRGHFKMWCQHLYMCQMT